MKKSHFLQFHLITWCTRPETSMISFWWVFGLTTVFMFSAKMVKGGEGSDICKFKIKLKKQLYLGIMFLVIELKINLCHAYFISTLMMS